ncbi:hypothetical protein OH77DRAFT_1310344 [Trametes cingulata]|nr:hypothetical protein OH77DRAFT_1310344 [Trametes cingulata]
MLESDGLPTEIWEAIIDCVWPDQEALQQCALTCHGWLPRSRYNLYRRVSILVPKQLSKLSRRLLTSPEEAELVQELLLAPPDLIKPQQVVDAAFAVFARRLPCLTKLFVNLLLHGDPVHSRMTLDLSLRMSSHIANFPTLTHVSLLHLALPSFMALARTIVALPRLTSLRLHNVSWNTVGKIPPDFLSTEPGWLNLESITVTSVWDSMPGISLLFGITSRRSLKSIVLDSYAATAPEFSHASHFILECASLDTLVIHNTWPAHAGNFEAFGLTLTGVLNIVLLRGHARLVLDFAHVDYTSRQDIVLVASNLALVMQNELLRLGRSMLEGLEIRIWDNSDRSTWWQAEIGPHFEGVVVRSLTMTVCEGWDGDVVRYEDGAV